MHFGFIKNKRINVKRVLQIIGIVCGGGVEAVIMNYYRNIDRTQIQFDFVVDGYEKTYLDDEIEAMGGKVYHVEPYRKNIFRYMGQIYKIVREGHYEIVHSNMNTLSVFSLFPAWLAGAEQRILHNHSTAVKQEGKRSLMKQILRPFAPIFANRYAACSELAGNWMYGKEKMKRGDISIIRNAIDLDQYAFSESTRAKYRQELGIGPDDFVIGHVGRFMFQKNHTFLIKIFREVKKVQHNAVLLLIGDGELRGKIEKQVQEYGLEDSVKFLGIRKDVQALYNAMDVFVLPSWYEGLPVVSVEAQANGLHCLFSKNVTAESGLTQSAEFIHLEDGAEVWAEKVLQKDNTRNPIAAEEMRQAGFDIKTQAQSLIEWYKQG
jgi:glycosyltransferase EpsF